MTLKKAIIEGFPAIHDIELEMPSVAELLSVPFWDRCSAEDVYKYGGDVGRYFLNKVPIKNDMKYVNVWINLQLLKPGVGSIKYKYNWHLDGSKVPFGAHERLFLVISDCTATTEFNKNRIEHYVDSEISHEDYDKYVNENAENIGIAGERVPPNKFIEFTSSHAHRATNPLKEEFRFLFRVCESNDLVSQPANKARLSSSHIYEEIGKSTRSIQNSDEDRIIINL